MASSENDLHTIPGLTAYLENTPFAASSIDQLSGGLGNFAFRIHLKTSHQGRNTVVVKHAKPYSASSPAFQLPAERTDFEVEAIQRLKTFLDPDSFVTVPTIHLYDASFRVIVMDDCGESSISLKRYLLETPPPLQLAQKIGDGLGSFLRRLHDWNKRDPSVIEYFDGNTQARNISAMITYGVVIDIITGVNPLPLLPDPPISSSSPEAVAVKALVDERTTEILNRKDVLTMGDFWPGNILLERDHASLHAIKRVYVLDWELVKPGLAGLDVGQFSAEIQSVALFYPESKGAANKVLTTFLSSYRHSGTQVDLEVARVAATHAGIHLATWTPRAGWGEARETKEAVNEGIRLMVEGHHAPEEWLLGSFVNPLIS